MDFIARILPILFLPAFFALYYYIWRWLSGRSKRSRRIASGECGDCGYSLKGSASTHCPECGAVVDVVKGHRGTTTFGELYRPVFARGIGYRDVFALACIINCLSVLTVIIWIAWFFEGCCMLGSIDSADSTRLVLPNWLGNIWGGAPYLWFAVVLLTQVLFLVGARLDEKSRRISAALSVVVALVPIIVTCIFVYLWIRAEVFA